MKYLISFVSAAALALAVGLALASHDSQHRSADGIEIYFGVVPAPVISGHEMGHGGSPRAKGSHHVVIALFDSKTGKRVTDAEVKASVAELGLAGQAKVLDPMKIAGTVTYGNYFKMPSAGPYRIAVEVRRPGAVHMIEAQFEYKRP